MDERIKNAEQALRNAHARGDTEAAGKLAKFLSEARAKPAEKPVLAHEEWAGGRISDMNPLEKAWMGVKVGGSKAAKGVVDLVADVATLAPVRKLVNMATGDDPGPAPERFPDWAEYNRLGSVAVQEGGFPAQAAEFGTSIVPEIGTAIASRGMSLPARLGINAAVPFATTDGDTIDRTISGTLGGLGYAAGATAGGAAKMASNAKNTFLDPFTPDGRMRTVRRVLESHSNSPKSLNNKINSPEKPLIDGYKYSLAESIPSDQGLAQLQRVSNSGSNPHFQRYLAALRERQNRVIERNLDEMSGAVVNPKTKMTAYDTATQQRELNASVNYGLAENTPLQFSKSMEKRINGLKNRPVMQEAIASAKTNLANKGKQMSPEGSFSGLQQTRDYLSRKLAAMQDPKANHTFDEIDGVRAALTDLDKTLSRVSPAYGKAQQAYKKDSIPVNQMDVANLLRQRLIAPMNDFSEQTAWNMRPSNYFNALRDRGGRDMDDARSLVKQATGMNKPLGDVLNGQQLYTVESIAKELARRERVDRAPKVGGESITKQLTSQQDILDRVAFPFLPTKFAIPAARMVGSVLGKEVEQAADITNRELARALIDPRRAQKALNTPLPANPFANSPNRWGTVGQGFGGLLDYAIQN